MALFTLQITDNTETCDFMGNDYRVEDGGFDISLPRVKRELTAERPGFYVPVIVQREYRECKMKFTIYGNTRTDALGKLQKLNRILKKSADRARLNAGARVQLSYAWDGSTNLTFFEVYSGDVAFATDILSVAKVHRTESGKYLIPNCELTLYLSANGYGLSLFSDSLTEIELYNPTVGAPQTGGVEVQNPGNDGEYNYVQIASSQVTGDSPWITKLQIASDSPYTSWGSLYIGHEVSPYPTKIVFDVNDKINGTGNLITNANANPNIAQTLYQYIEYTYASAPWYPSFSQWAWELDQTSKGTFVAFVHFYNAQPINTFSMAIGIDDFVTWGVSYVEEWVRITNANKYNAALGTIVVPPGGRDLDDYGNLDPDLWLGLWVAYDVNFTLRWDYVSLLPMSNGLRIWKAKVSALTGTFYDDDWRGLAYIKNASNLVSTPFYPLLDAIKLEPNVEQRLYFTSLGYSNLTTERHRTFLVRVFAVPTYNMLAL